MSAPRTTWSRRSAAGWNRRLRAMSDNDMVKRLAWAGLLASVGALASIATTRLAALIYRRLFREDPPE